MSAITNQSMASSGLRLRNWSSVECYLNTAVNTIVTNDIVMLEIGKQNPLKNWMGKVLKDHKPGGLEREMTRSYDELQKEMELFFEGSQGCRESHGDLCFQSRKNEYRKNRENLSVLEELKVMVGRKNEVQDALHLKDLLRRSFGILRGNVQQDAQDAYLSILYLT